MSVPVNEALGIIKEELDNCGHLMSQSALSFARTSLKSSSPDLYETYMKSLKTPSPQTEFSDSKLSEFYAFLEEGSNLSKQTSDWFKAEVTRYHIGLLDAHRTSAMRTLLSRVDQVSLKKLPEWYDSSDNRSFPMLEADKSVLLKYSSFSKHLNRHEGTFQSLFLLSAFYAELFLASQPGYLSPERLFIFHEQVLSQVSTSVFSGYHVNTAIKRTQSDDTRFKYEFKPFDSYKQTVLPESYTLPASIADVDMKFNNPQGFYPVIISPDTPTSYPLDALSDIISPTTSPSPASFASSLSNAKITERQWSEVYKTPAPSYALPLSEFVHLATESNQEVRVSETAGSLFFSVSIPFESLSLTDKLGYLRSEVEIFERSHPQPGEVLSLKGSLMKLYRDIMKLHLNPPVDADLSSELYSPQTRQLLLTVALRVGGAPSALLNPPEPTTP